MKIKTLFGLAIIMMLFQACYEDNVDAEFDYQKGDVILMVSTFSSQTDSVEFYWDDIKIATIYESPYVYYFNVSDNISSGTHKYSMKIYYRISETATASIENNKTVRIK